jgi:hypothetical protein
MESVLASVATMGTGQILLACVFLGCYALALGDFAGARGGLVATVAAILAAVGFVILSNPWEAGVILLALVPVGMGLFAGAAWMLCTVTLGNTRPVTVVAPSPVLHTGRPASASLVQRLRARLRLA